MAQKPKPPTKPKAAPQAAVKKKAVKKQTDSFELEPSKSRKLYLTDVALRDGHQSLLATRMRTEDLIPAAQELDKVGFWSLEVWGGATFDACLRFLKEDPWERLKTFRKAAPNTRLQMLLRGQNLVGYRHYADDVLKEFIVKSAEHGIDVFRIFDALNDIRNIKPAMKVVKQCKKHVEATICYTVSPVHSLHHYVEQAKELEDLGTDSICIKDMAGLLPPFEAYELVKRMKAAVRVPIHLHTHYTSGMASMSSLMAILGGLDILDTAMSPLSGGTSHPPTETFIAALKGTPYDTGLDLKQLTPAAALLREARKKYHQFESDFTGVDTDILLSQVPGGMLSNLASQLAEQNAIEKMQEVLEEIPKVRKDMGYPPLVTPSSQIVGSQATMNVLTGERYKVITNETKNYFLGFYGKPPGSLDSKVRQKAMAGEKPITGRPADNLDPELKVAKKELSEHQVSPEDILSYALFPSVALQFIDERERGELKPEVLEPISQGGKSPTAQNLHLAPVEFRVMLHGETYHIHVSGSGQTIDGRKPYYIKVDDKLEEVYLEPLQEVLASGPEAPISSGTAKGGRPKPSGPGDVTTPMPGRVVKVLVAEGDQVANGNPLLVIEAMKMENQVTAPMDGTVKAIHVKEGDQVNSDETLIQIE
ncbi:MAG: sodium-extruding oxaloacetate decarboxylase subunit alpha [Nitrospirae bacterium]|nr:sodium-extruding oxaloacetate decarboxylase subunit alpha [Nitrospirota bacterium]MDA1304660.1 sodium-extruding oxaloacetate decarboxylase subunit alpha [Nitrospirota bacterium]